MQLNVTFSVSLVFSARGQVTTAWLPNRRPPVPTVKVGNIFLLSAFLRPQVEEK